MQIPYVLLQRTKANDKTRNQTEKSKLQSCWSLLAWREDMGSASGFRGYRPRRRKFSSRGLFLQARRFHSRRFTFGLDFGSWKSWVISLAYWPRVPRFSGKPHSAFVLYAASTDNAVFSYGNSFFKSRKFIPFSNGRCMLATHGLSKGILLGAIQIVSHTSLPWTERARCKTHS
jgi:hypothetical protein